MRVTLAAIKADVGSIGGHTRPTDRMVAETKRRVSAAVGGLLIDGMVTYTGDDIPLLMSHKPGTGADAVHKFAWDCFLAATASAKEEGCYGAGQDLLVDAPSGNVRGAGPGVAEIEFERDPKSAERPAEAFIILTADKCGPRARRRRPPPPPPTSAAPAPTPCPSPSPSAPRCTTAACSSTRRCTRASR